MATFNLDTPITRIGNNKVAWTIRNSVEGLQIFGGIGSGKTSGSGRYFALKYLSTGYGGLVLTVKPDEKDEWVKYCKITGREDDLIIVEPNGKHSFNFLDYESRQDEYGKSYTDNILQVLKTVIRAGEEKAHGKSDDSFWENALDLLIANSIDLCLLAFGKVSVSNLYYIIRSAPTMPIPKTKKTENELATEEPVKEQTLFKIALAKAIENVQRKVRIWQSSIPLDERVKMDEYEMNQKMEEHIPETRTLMFVDEFFTETYANLSEKTRSIVDFSFTSFLFHLLKDPVYSLFCNKPSTFTPEDCLNGKIIVINLPVKIYQKVGRDVQILFKYIWQRAMEKRNINENERPVFLWADEAQNFLHEYDPDYQATARSSRIATVYISQNIPNYYANMGGGKAEYKVKSFLGTLATKIFHANADIETNKYASELIGEAYTDDQTFTRGATDGKVSASTANRYHLTRIVRPEEFQTLLTGGEMNENKVMGYIHVQGLQINEHYNHFIMRFTQDYKP